MLDWWLRYYKAGRVKNLVVAGTLEDETDPTEGNRQKYSIYWEAVSPLAAQGLLHRALSKINDSLDAAEEADLHDKTPEDDP
jgi:hypothetical protein